MDEATRALLNRNIAALADGERSAFDAVYGMLWPLLIRFITKVSGDRMVAEDMVQQAMLKILSRVATFDRSQDALAWSMTIAMNEYRSHRRKLGNRDAGSSEWTRAEPSDDDTPEAITIRNNLTEALRAVLGQLRPRDLEVIVAAISEGQRPQLTAAAFRKRLQRAMANTRLIWKKQYGDDRTG